MFVFPPTKQIDDVRLADGQAVRLHNAALIARLVWESEDGISRSILARTSGLSRSTVWAIAAELLAEGILVEHDQPPPSRSGRPPTMLTFNAHRQHVIGVELGASHVLVALCDLHGRVLWSRWRDHDVPQDAAGTMRVLGDLISACRTLSVASGALLGIGVAVPCPVDALSPDHMSPRLMPAWTQVRLAEQLFQRHGVRVFVDNDANCGAMAEALFGAGRDVPVFTYIKVATGCGAGHIVGRRPYRGISGSAGEIGHTTVDPNGRPCRCGLRGCLEAEIGSAALIAQTQRALDTGQSSSLAEVSPLTLADIVRAANDGDIVACEIVAEAGRHLAVGVANLLNLLNPARVIIGGRLAETGDALLAPLRRAVHDRALWTSVERADIVASAMGRDVVAIGAASLVVQAGLDDLELFRTPTNAEAA